MDYDVIIIGAGLSGLAAGIRLAYFGKRVCILERHYAYGGMNSYYTIDGRQYDVGLHAVTNFAPRGKTGAPLTKLLRQLRIDWNELQLHEQHFSQVQFPGRSLKFTNDIAVLEQEVAREFPSDSAGFRRLVADIREYDNVRLDAEHRPTRIELARYLSSRVLIDMLLCPIMFYGSAEEHDMDYNQFVTMFKSIFLEGFSRPTGGVRTMLTMLVKKFRTLGGKIRMQAGVQSLQTRGDRVMGVIVDSGETLTAETVFSCAGYPETMRLSGQPTQAVMGDVGRVSFVETIVVLDRPPRDLGLDSTIIFFNDADDFVYAKPETAIDLRSGILCCPNSYHGLEEEAEYQARLTWMANYDEWVKLDESSYAEMKQSLLNRAIETIGRFVPEVSRHIVASDMFTPRTIEHFTGRIAGAVYGSPTKHRDGRTPFRNLFICGTDQGFLGIIGSMLSGITIANVHVLSES